MKQPTKRQTTRYNPVAKELRTPRYRSKVKQGRPKVEPETIEDALDEYYDELEDTEGFLDEITRLYIQDELEDKE